MSRCIANGRPDLGKWRRTFNRDRQVEMRAEAQATSLIILTVHHKGIN
jgi:hypothetical protein